MGKLFDDARAILDAATMGLREKSPKILPRLAG